MPGSACPRCGWAEGTANPFPLTLPLSTILLGRYITGQVLGKGGFGVTYLAYDVKEDKRVAVKEYLPDALTHRNTGETVVSVYGGEKEEAFKKGAERFYEEAQTVSRFNGHPNIVGVQGFFYENETAYYVMEFLEGMDLKRYIAQHGGRLGEERTLEILRPLVDALIVVHSVGILHRDISPDNIYMTGDGKIKLLDFGAARQVMGEASKSLSVVLKQGFAPFEQYQTRGKQGPWTDMYALGATAYYCLTGQIPLSAMDRMSAPELDVPCSADLRAKLEKMMAVHAVHRYQNMMDAKTALFPDWVPSLDEAPPAIPAALREISGPQEKIATVLPADAEPAKHASLPLLGKLKGIKIPRLAVVAAAASAVVIIAAVSLIIALQPRTNPVGGGGGSGANPGRTAAPATKPAGNMKYVEDKSAIWLDPFSDELHFGRYTGYVLLEGGLEYLEDENGTFVCDDDDCDFRYTGGWVSDEMSGRGKITYAENDSGGRISYEGDLKADKGNGWGTMVWTTGEYTGEIKDGSMHGQGTLTFAKDNENKMVSYVGAFKDGLFDGLGTLTWQTTDYYIGDFKKGTANGMGTYYWADGSKYIGNFKDGAMNGYGTGFAADGTVMYDGQWKNGEFIG